MFHIVTKTEERYRCIFSFTDENKARDYYNRAAAAVVEKGGECSLLNGEQLVQRVSAPPTIDLIARSLCMDNVRLFDEIHTLCERSLNEPLEPAEYEASGLGYSRHPTWGPEVMS